MEPFLLGVMNLGVYLLYLANEEGNMVLPLLPL